MIARLIRRLDTWWARHERIDPADQAKIDAWAAERRERDANATFTPDAEQDIGNDDPRPPTDHQPAAVDPQHEAHLPTAFGHGRHTRPFDEELRYRVPAEWLAIEERLEFGKLRDRIRELT